MQKMSISNLLAVQSMNRGDGFRAQGVRGDAAVLDPYLMADHFRMSQPTFGPHPHAGFSAVTYLFDDAQTGFNNRDSLGDSSLIRPGDLHWTTAGAGVVHDEVPATTGLTAHGVQIFVNLAHADKHIPPGSIHIDRERMPRFVQPGGARVKVVFGAYNDGHNASQPVAELPTNVTLFDVQLSDNQRFTYPAPPSETVFLLAVAGAVQVDGQLASEGHAVAFGRSDLSALIEVVAPGSAQFVLFMGQPLGEPVVKRGPFAMANQADLERAEARYRAGEMGHLPAAA